MKDLGKVTATKHDLYSTFDVTDQGYIINERSRKLRDVFKDVYDTLKRDYPDLAKDIEYFSIFPTLTRERPFPLGARIAIFYVEGSSEGYYVHVEAHDGETRELLFLGKTLLEGESGISWAEQMVCALSRIMRP